MASFNVTIIDNNQVEGSGTFHLIINASSLPHNINISYPSQATVTILDDDSKQQTYCATTSTF